MIDDWPHTIRCIAEAVIAVCAAYAAYRSRANATTGEATLKELKANPEKTVEAMAKANGPLSGVLNACKFQTPGEQQHGG